MNKIKYITMAAMAAILITSCEKEDGINPSINSNQSIQSEKLAENIMKSAYDKIGSMDKIDLINKIDLVKESLDSKLNSDKSEEPILLDDIFTLYEAAINGTFPSGKPEDGGESFESSFIVPVSEDGGNYYVSETDFANFYLALQADMNNELEPNSNQYFGLADLTLSSVNSANATIGISFVIGTPVPPITMSVPSGAIYGAELEGWCSNPIWGVDASLILPGHANSQAQFSSNPTPQRYVIIQQSYFTQDLVKQNQLGVNSTYINNTIWKSPNNSCIGDDIDQINNEFVWTNYFRYIDRYVEMPLPYLNANYSNLTQFLYTDFRGVDNWFNSSNWFYQNGRYDHRGTFYYGLCVVC